jgi:hypothetical protein
MKENEPCEIVKNMDVRGGGEKLKKNERGGMKKREK